MKKKNSRIERRQLRQLTEFLFMLKMVNGGYASMWLKCKYTSVKTHTIPKYITVFALTINKAEYLSMRLVSRNV